MNKKPIHKFNGGRGATLCNKCRGMISEGLTKELLCDKCKNNDEYNVDKDLEMTSEPVKKYKLVRHDGLTKTGDKIMWVEFSEGDGYFSSKHDEPAVKRSLVLDFYGLSYTWMTTTVNEIIENRIDYVKFQTKNSTYELFINQ
jgi:hypothetical protein